MDITYNCVSSALQTVFLFSFSSEIATAKKFYQHRQDNPTDISEICFAITASSGKYGAYWVFFKSVGQKYDQLATASRQAAMPLNNVGADEVKNLFGTFIPRLARPVYTAAVLE